MRDEAERMLGAILTSGADVHRCAAARALGAAGRPGGPAPAALVQALLDEDPDVRVDAAQALAELADPATAGALLDNLRGDPESDVKKAAIQALVAMEGPGPEVVTLLRKLAVERTDEVFWDEDEFYQEGWDSWVDIQLLAIEALGRLGDTGAVAAIERALADEEGQDVQPVAIAALARLGAEGARALTRLLEHAPALTRGRIARVVAETGNPGARALEERLLADPDPDIRVIALGGLAPEDLRLEPLFADEAPEVRAAVVAHAGAHFPGAAQALFADPSPGVRRAAFTLAAGQPALFGSKKARAAIRAGIAEDPQAASAAALAWVAIRGARGIRGFRHVLERPGLPLEYRLGVVRALRRAGPAATPLLLPALGDEARQLRLDAMTALAELATEDPAWPNPAGQALLAALGGELVPPPGEAETEPAAVAGDGAGADRPGADGPPPVPAPEGSTLAAILHPAPPPDTPPPDTPPPDTPPPDGAGRLAFRGRRAAPEVTVAPHEDVRRFAAMLLGNVARPGVADALLGVLEEADAQLLTAALSSLAEIGARTGLAGDMLEPLAGFLATGLPEARPLAVRALSYIPDPEVDGRLETLAGDGPEMVRVEAIRGLERRGLAPAVLRAALDDPYPGVACAAARALARNVGAGAVADLVRFACSNDGTWRADVARWLGESAPEAALAGFTALLRDDGRRRDWLVAIDALAVLLAQPDPKRMRVAA